MKKILFLFAIMILALSSCVSLPSPKSYTSVIDYSFFTDKGIFVTESNSVNFEYEPMGSVVVEVTGGWIAKKSKKQSTPKNEVNDDYYLDIPRQNGGKKVYVGPSLNEAFGLLADELINMKANGIINLKISQGVRSDNLFVSGMAITK